MAKNPFQPPLTESNATDEDDSKEFVNDELAKLRISRNLSLLLIAGLLLFNANQFVRKGAPDWIGLVLLVGISVQAIVSSVKISRLHDQ